MFYNYDTRPAALSSQIINLEQMVHERDDRIERLENELAELRKQSQRQTKGIYDLQDRLRKVIMKHCLSRPHGNCCGAKNPACTGYVPRSI